MPDVTTRRTPSRPSRSDSSPAALRVKVTARTCRGSMAPSAASQAIRRVRTRVFPDPAPARIASGDVRVVTASRCRSFRSDEQLVGIAHEADGTGGV